MKAFLFAPSNLPSSQEQVLLAKALLEQTGFAVTESQYMFHRNINNLATELTEILRNGEYDLAIPLKGGVGALDVAAKIDWRSLTGTSKTVLAGFSDGCFLTIPMTELSGRYVIHSPLPTKADYFSLLARESLKRSIEFLRSHHGSLHIDWMRFEAVSEKKTIKGKLFGGYLPAVVKYLREATNQELLGKVILFETIDQPNDELLSDLRLLLSERILSQIHGLIVGDVGSEELLRFILKEAKNRAEAYSVPVWTTPDVGHTLINRALPMGINIASNNDNIPKFFLEKD